MLRRVRRRFLPAHIRADIRDTQLLVALLEEVLEPDSDCLDVGAHAGSVLREMVRIAPRGRHVAWEPLPAFAARLRDEFPDVEVREAALGDQRARAPSPTWWRTRAGAASWRDRHLRRAPWRS